MYIFNRKFGICHSQEKNRGILYLSVILKMQLPKKKKKKLLDERRK